MLNLAAVEALVRGDHGDPFALLGPHLVNGSVELRVFQPDARSVEAIDPASGTVLATLDRRHAAGFFAGLLGRPPGSPYRLRVAWGEGRVELEDPYRFPAVLGELDVWLLAEGTHRRPFERLGAHPHAIDGVAGMAFAVWAPGASRVSVVGDFNQWDGRRHPMRLRRECGVWELFLPGVVPGQHYKFEIKDTAGTLLPLKADPYGFAAELRPATASIVAVPPRAGPPDPAAPRRNALDAPVSIYEVHAGSWRRHPDGNGFLSWQELADQLVPYAVEMGFTHLEFLPITEHPFDGSWGYQPVGLYAPTARFGPPDGFRRLVERCHEAGLGVLLDWVPAHFPNDPHGLALFDGTHLYDHADPRQGFHRDWNTLIYNFGRREVSNFLHGNALYWLERFRVDGLRVDAVASMLYLDYSRAAGEWVPNRHGGRENLEAIDFLRRLNELVGAMPGPVMIAEESTAWPMVSRPTAVGGLGFHYKWNMGWMHDTLAYMSREPAHRRFHHDQMTFGLVYAFHENFILPLSHDEVVHGKGSLIGKMPGDPWQRFANLRAYYGFMWAHPGKKLLFMGGEFGQWAEWDHDRSLDWHLLGEAPHAGLQRLVRDLNRAYREIPALHQRDCEPGGFEWIDINDRDQSVLSWLRRGRDARDLAIVVCNFTPVPRYGYRLGVPAPGFYRERLNTDARIYGGGDVGNGGGVVAEAAPAHGRPCAVTLTLPPLATLILTWEGAAA
ncbi:MAG: 1,4-alpha-glucan branching protein GlgB [Dongiaceae bacterium]